MRIHKLNDFVGGWFIGNFTPTMSGTEDFEVCLKRYKSGDREPVHYQLSATEFTLVVEGKVRMGGLYLERDDILEIPPLVAADFEALTDAVVVAVKTPSLPSDKVLGNV